MSGDYLWDRSGPQDAELVRLEQVLGTLAQSVPPPALRVPPAPPARRRPAVFLAVFAAAAVIIIALVGVAWRARLQPVPGFEVTRLAGTPMIGSQRVPDRARLPVGRWLETGEGGRASIDLAQIGRIELEPHTRLGLLSTRKGDYRLRLARGTMQALILAPPAQVFVETPSATAIDLGCMYTLTVDDDGVGLVKVTLGWVGFEWQGRESFISAGAVALTRPGFGPGTPHFENVSDAFRAALALIDVNGGDARARYDALSLVLDETRERDALTLWHLLSRVETDERDRVFDRLARFVPPPADVTRDGIRAGERAMLDSWWDALGFGTAAWWRIWKQQWR